MKLQMQYNDSNRLGSDDSVDDDDDKVDDNEEEGEGEVGGFFSLSAGTAVIPSLQRWQRGWN